MATDSDKYDIALSFAGENREYVKQVAEILRSSNVRVFYDAYEEVALWGRDLYQHLADVYRNSRYCVIFLSAAYANKLWTRHELKSAQARAFQEKREYILPVRFDNTEIPGVLETIAYIDLRSKTPDDLAQLILRKLSGESAVQPAPARRTRWDILRRRALKALPLLLIVAGAIVVLYQAGGLGKKTVPIPPMVTYVKGHIQLAKTSFRFPGDGKPNKNKIIGDFCCTGETATIETTQGIPAGFIYFYDFPGGGVIVGDGSRSTAQRFAVHVSGLSDPARLDSPRVKEVIIFDAGEMVIGTVRTVTAGALRFSAMIEDARFDQRYGVRFLMDTVRVKVDVDVHVNPQ
jgi:TIR domain